MLKRFALDNTDEMVEVQDGDYVKYEDFKKVLEALEQAKKMNDHIFEKGIVNWGASFCKWSILNESLIAVDSTLALFKPGKAQKERRNMNKRQLVDLVAQQTKEKRSRVEKIVTNFLSTVKDRTAKGHDAAIQGFGTFTKTKKKARLGRNPQTGAVLKLSAKWYPKFKPSANFKAVVR